MVECSTLTKTILIITYITNICQSRLKIIQCDDDKNDCQQTIINCPSDEDCLVLCESPSICSNSTINCPSNHECTINCDDMAACKSTTIYAASSSLLQIQGCHDDESCIDITIWCPQTIEPQNQNCLLEGNENLGSSDNTNININRGLQIYAINGWSDISIDYTHNDSLSLSSDINKRGTMYCSTNYSKSCDISITNWSCTDTQNECNNIVITTTNTPSESANNNNNKTIDVQMVIIIIGIFAAICYIGFCCWYTQKSKKSNDGYDTSTDLKRQNVSASQSKSQSQSMANGKDVIKIPSASSVASMSAMHSNSRNIISPSSPNVNHHKPQTSASGNHLRPDTHIATITVSAPRAVSTSISNVSAKSHSVTYTNNSHHSQHNNNNEIDNILNSRNPSISKSPSANLNPSPLPLPTGATTPVVFLASKSAPVGYERYTRSPPGSVHDDVRSAGRSVVSARSPPKPKTPVEPIKLPKVSHSGNSLGSSGDSENRQTVGSVMAPPFISDSPVSSIATLPKDKRHSANYAQIMPPMNNMSVIDEIDESDAHGKNITFTELKQRANMNWNNNQNNYQYQHMMVHPKQRSVSSTGDNKRMRAPLDMKADNSISTDMSFMKSPDTWDNFDRENGIFNDNHMMVQMMGQLEEGDFACSYD